MNEILRGFYELNRGIQKLQKLALKSQKNKTLILLILLSGVFCLRSIFIPEGFYARADQDYTDQWLESSITGSQKISLSSDSQRKREVLEDFANYYLPENEGKKLQNSLEIELGNLVGNAPIKEMVPYISGYNREIAGLVVGIAKKESDWGKHSPSKDGLTCYNYWGYKSAGTRGTSMGYACFGSAEEAVKAIGGRIEHFVSKNLNTPSKMVVWKCGSSCSWDNPANVQKWVSDVSKYYNQIAYK
jgi:hypothetical protein